MILLSPIHVRVAFFFFLIHTLPAAAEINEDFCDRTVYGQPDYPSCVTVLYGRPPHRSGSIFNIDNHEHGFLLPYFGGDGHFTIDQWRHRVYLPTVWHNEQCKIALLVRLDPSGGFTTDSGSWSEIARRGKALVEYCLVTRREMGQYAWGGGVGYAGTHNRLDIVVYAWGSAFDLAITSGIRPGGLVGVDGNGMILNSSAGGRIGNLSDV